MYRKRLRRLLIPLVLASGLFFLLETPVAGDLAWLSTAPHGHTAFIFMPSTAVAASTAVPSDTQLPPHAVSRPWGSGWECQRGYRRAGERCVEVGVPPHALLGAFGHDWECERGYRREDERCVPVQVPKHAHLDITGHNWECQRGYRRAGERCVEVDVPSHAFLDYFGHAWQCDRGYQQEGERCVPVQVPEHAHLAYSGHNWACNDGYQRVDNTCEPTPGGTLNRAASPESDLAQLATQVYANREASHDGQTIQDLQRQLQQAGYDPGPSDGILGPRTLVALQQFLADSGLASGTVPQAATPSAPGS